jgi:hypothetical protein
MLTGFVGVPPLPTALAKDGCVIGAFPLFTAARLLSIKHLAPIATFNLSNWVSTLIASATASVKV